MRSKCLKSLRKNFGLISSKEMCFNDFGTRFCPHTNVQNISYSNRNVELSKNKCIQFVKLAPDSDLEEGVDEMQHYESEDGVLFTLQR